jgi:High potential iron-sulfur protein
MKRNRNLGAHYTRKPAGPPAVPAKPLSNQIRPATVALLYPSEKSPRRPRTMTQNPERRRMLGIASLALAGAALTRASGALAQSPLPHLSESDPTAVSLGYREDAKKVDHGKYASYTPGSMCANCSLFQGKRGDAWGPCPIYAGKQVNAKGWCSAYVKKA